MLKLKFLENDSLRIGIVALLVLVAMYLRFERLEERDLWGDELYIHSSSVNPICIWDQPLMVVHKAYLKISHFPGDMTLIWPFHLLFGDNKWGLALPHILLTILGFCLLYQMCAIYYKTLVGFVVAFLVVAMNANLIFHSFELGRIVCSLLWVWLLFL
jgi:hypothetical protein